MMREYNIVFQVYLESSRIYEYFPYYIFYYILVFFTTFGNLNMKLFSYFISYIQSNYKELEVQLIGE